MEERVIQGVRIQGNFSCKDCGASVSDADLAWLSRTYQGIANICGFCGKPIRILSVHGLVHHHATPEDRETQWDFNSTVEEEHFSWMTRRKDWALDLHAHLSCAQAACPYGDWDGDGQHHLDTTAGRSVDNLGIESPCPKCGAVPTEEDRTKALRWLFKIHDRPCAICGRGFSLHTATIAHRHLFKDQECKQWSVPDWRVEECVDWCAHLQIGTSYRSVDMRSHSFCARRVLPHAIWTPPLPRRAWVKQDWSCRIEPWFFGRIPGEAAPDWSRVRAAAEIRQLWREK